VGQLQAGHDVAHGVDTVDRGAAALVGDDETAFEGDPGLLVPQAVGDRPAASRTVTAPASTVADSNRTPVRKAMPRLRNARSSAVLTAGSSAATSRGSASTMVTSAPNERITEANSTPITPPPSTTTRAGTASSASAPSLVTMGPPISSPGSVRA
jgi:hypothetical protein